LRTPPYPENNALRIGVNLSVDVRVLA